VLQPMSSKEMRIAYRMPNPILQSDCNKTLRPGGRAGSHRTRDGFDAPPPRISGVRHERGFYLNIRLTSTINWPPWVVAERTPGTVNVPGADPYGASRTVPLIDW